MSAVGHVLVSEPVTASELVDRMGISFETLCHAVQTDLANLDDGGPHSWRTIASLWKEMTALFGGEENARRFLNQPRPELADETPLHYLDSGEPEIVTNLVFAMREMLP